MFLRRRGDGAGRCQMGLPRRSRAAAEQTFAGAAALGAAAPEGRPCCANGSRPRAARPKRRWLARIAGVRDAFVAAELAARAKSEALGEARGQLGRSTALPTRHELPLVPRTRRDTSPWHTYLAQVDRVLPYLGPLARWSETLKRPKRALIVDVPIEMDDGTRRPLRGLPRPAQPVARPRQGRRALPPRRDARGSDGARRPG